MHYQSLYALLADAVLLAHVALVVFIVGGLVLVVAGHLAGWRWTRRRGFRLTHLLAILFVVGETLLGQVCPLTTLEMSLRQLAGEAIYGQSFVSHWLSTLLYYDAPAWLFAVAYTLFALCVVAAWWLIPPFPRRRRAGAR